MIDSYIIIILFHHPLMLKDFAMIILNTYELHIYNWERGSMLGNIEERLYCQAYHFLFPVFLRQPI